jgi:transmembrane sensor
MRDDEHQESLGEAIGWHLRLRDNNPEDWDAFVAWLEGDPQRSIDYDTVSLAASELTAEAIPTGQADEEAAEPPALPSRPRWGLAAAAAAVVAIAASVVVVAVLPQTARYEIATGPGEQRKVAIADGSFAELNGGTRLVLDRKDARYAELISGEATFTVQHDPSAPFIVTVGEQKVQDVGTVFNIVREKDRTRLDVLQGQVLFNPDRQRVAVAAGKALLAFDKDQVVVKLKRVETMAGWRSGQLSFANEPIANVAGDLARTLGTPIAVDPRLAAQSFTGSVRVEGDATIQRLAATMGAAAHRRDSGWLIEPS